MKTTLIITTYNRPDALTAVLASALAGRVLPAEIVIADDGSGAATQAVVAHFAAISPIPVRHVWQPDEGFRAAECRNRAIAASHGEHIVMIDGDMLLQRDFIADHRAVIAPRRVIQGSRVLLSPDLTAEILRTPSVIPRLPWYRTGLTKRHAAWRWPWAARWWVRQPRATLHGVRSCNLAFWRGDALEVNGFNQDFVGWGYEDSEFVARLLHAGVQRHDLRLAGVAYHLWHAEATRARLAHNNALFAATLAENKTRCQNGLDRFLSAVEVQKGG